MADRNELADRIRGHQWFHSMDLGDGLVTRGDSAPSELIARAMPDLRGKSVLDVGAWDGKYSFEAEAAGASRVVALDHYVWRLDPAARQAYYDRCEAEGILPDPDRIDRGFLVEGDFLPGKQGFDLVHAYLDSKVEAVVDDFTTMDLDRLGCFDVVLYLGVLYHMVDPLGALQRLRRVTAEVALIETAGIEVPGYTASSLVEFYPGDALHADYGNWFAPSAAALLGMCRAAGFRRAELKGSTAGPTSRRFKLRDDAGAPVPGRLVAHAYV
jgi:tRNA (mo5U34)-methyltransferase